MQKKILYVCEPCFDYALEICGYGDRSELRVMPNGTWVCETCYDADHTENTPNWRDLPVPPEYAPKES